MRCAHYGKDYIKDYLQQIECYCLANKMSAQYLTDIFKNCLVAKEIVYQKPSTGINKITFQIDDFT